MVVIQYLTLVVIAVVVVAILLRHRDAAGRARILKLAGFTLIGIFVGSFAAFVIGDTLSDPGGWLALGLIASWLVPMLAFAALAWYRPDQAVRVFAVLIGLTTALAVWVAIDPHGWRSFEDEHGPIRTIVVFTVSAAVALLGLKRTAAAGVLLLILAIPLLAASLGGGPGSAALLVASVPTITTAILYLASASVASRSTPPRRSDAGPQEYPNAA